MVWEEKDRIKETSSESVKRRKRNLSLMDKNKMGKRTEFWGDRGSLGWKSGDFWSKEAKGELEFRQLPTVSEASYGISSGGKSDWRFPLSLKKNILCHRTRWLCNKNTLAVSHRGCVTIFWEVSSLPPSIQCWWDTAVPEIEKRGSGAPAVFITKRQQDP